MSSLRLSTKEEVPAGKIIGIVRNYARHASEMGGTAPERPVFFLKPSTSILHDGGTVILPEPSQRVEHEVELAVVISRTTKAIPKAAWKDHVLGFGIILDMTARDLQEAAKKQGDPWDLAKGFDTFSPISTIIEKGRVNDPQALELQLRVNGELRQQGHTKDMVFGVAELIHYLSSVMTLERGDVIATGSPEGVATVKRGDKLEARIPGLVTLAVKVDEPKRRG